MNSRPQRVAIVGGGIAGLTAAWQLARIVEAGAAVEATVFEASSRFGGIVETVRRDGFTVECGPDGWVSEKPWARELAVELGLEDELMGSNDAGRITYILKGGRLQALPDGMRMMVPGDLTALRGSALFSPEAQAAYAAEPSRAEALKAAAPAQDESIAAFVERHFGREVLETVAAPLLSGVFGGDVAQLSVRAVMPAFVQMEREHGSLIVGLQAVQQMRAGAVSQPIFTTLKTGLGSLVERLLAGIPSAWRTLSTPVDSIAPDGRGWRICTTHTRETFDSLLLAVPAHNARKLLENIVPAAASLMEMESSSAIIVALGFDQDFSLPSGFGFLVPAGEGASLLAATFTDQKFAHRAPPGKRLLRAFFGGPGLSPEDARSDEQLVTQASGELSEILGPLPQPRFSVVRRWPRSLPQYGVGHLDRMARLDRLMEAHPNLHLLGNGWRGVGLPDLIRDARAAARRVCHDFGDLPSDNTPNA